MVGSPAEYKSLTYWFGVAPWTGRIGGNLSFAEMFVTARHQGSGLHVLTKVGGRCPVTDEKPKKWYRGWWWKFPVAIVGLAVMLSALSGVNDYDSPNTSSTSNASNVPSVLKTADASNDTSTKAADTPSVPKPVDVADAAETAKKAAVKACKRLAPQIVRLSKRNAGPLQATIIKLYDIQAQEPPPNEPHKIYLTYCSGLAKGSRGTDNMVDFFMVKDSDGERFIGYNEQ